ncbi:helix-turn-helix domain-containing protein [Streptomyces spongiicola]|uniref:Helix-turn-helix domain-containing protein n=1 Tax=Streptomyces spongiicola TaxID=1690221 RepID=A0A388SYI5_9ACTN|nr:XRE family transcriptional regulator [Streptomyces spongiicola]GBQ01386.1 helix-turn-helix domain-containing protein [Streptomyces spongiicola]
MTTGSRDGGHGHGEGRQGDGTELARILDGIGPRLRGLRRERGLTLEALAATTGISVSTLSRVESGKRRPTLDLLIPLARAHRVALDQLVAAPPSGDPRVHLRPLHRERGSVLVPLTQYPGRVQVFKQVLAPRPPEPVVHEGYEWLYVLAGRLRLILGSEEFTLRPGEVAEFDTTEPHWFGPADATSVEILHLFGPRGDQAVMRAGPSTPAPHGPEDGGRLHQARFSDTGPSLE